MGYDDWQLKKFGNVIKSTTVEQYAFAKKNAGELQDTDLMPWGKFKNQAMINVPATYLLFLYYGKDLKDVRVKKYIQDNLQVLEKQAK